jgi:ubiquinone/menaquinone biosynthesis C-methylase UbiE
MTDKKKNNQHQEIHAAVRAHYSAAVSEKHIPSTGVCCCGSNDSACCGEELIIYDDPAVNDLPKEVTEISLGCGDPVTLASLKPGQTVLDLGSGGGIDCFLAAQKVGETGQVIGVDMTPVMLDRARKNNSKIGAKNVEFRLGEIEHLPVGDGLVDVVISNCVINLSPDKEQVFHEIFRVLKPGGRVAVSDMVTQGDLPPEIKEDLAAWAGCISGAVDVEVYTRFMEVAGLVNITVTPVYLPDEMIREALSQIPSERKIQPDLEVLKKTIFSAKITAQKP